MTEYLVIYTPDSIRQITNNAGATIAFISSIKSNLY